MSISRRSFIARASSLAAFGALELTEDASSAAVPSAVRGGATVHLPPTKLHGYGTISAAFRGFEGGLSSLTHITCESAQKALLTQAKYLSDLDRLPGLEKAILLHRGRSIPYRRTLTGGAAACFADGHDVLILAVAQAEALARLCDTLPATASGAHFTARAQVPMYLDRWDRYGLICYMAPDALPPGSAYMDRSYDYGDALKFASDNNVGLILWVNLLVDDTAEGLTNEQSWGWVQQNALKMGVPVHINTQISLPQLWLGNRYREQTMLNAPQFLGGYYGVGHDSAGMGAISWLSQEAEDAQLGVIQQMVRRFAEDSNIVGWLEPHGETYETPQKYFLDSGPYADEVWREFLRSRYGTLRAVSLRWHGTARQYKSWSEIRVPEVAEFAGFGPRAIDLRGAWRVKYLAAPDGHDYTHDEARRLPSPPPTAAVPPEWYQPDFDDSEWDEFVAPGNDRMLSLKRSPLIYRRSITISGEWLAANPQTTLYIWDMVNRESDATSVYVNGHQLSERAHNSNDNHWSQFDAAGVLKAGANLMVIQMPRAIICYRAYLTGEPPNQYPHLGGRQNARWADFAEWNIESRGAQIRRGAEMIRQADPNRSINFMAATDYSDPIKKTCQDYGGRFHDTGAMAGFWTEENTLLMSGIGLPTTAEPGNGAPNPREFQLFWGRWLTEGVNGVHYFQNWGEIAWNPDVLKIFEANRPMYQAVGKYHSPFARVAVLYSLQSAWLTGFPWTPDSGSRGGYYSAFNAAGHLINCCPRDGIGAADFRTSLVDRYRVIIDSNSTYMNEELVSGIERFVRRGGIFVTYGQTGRHTPTQPDAWPISRMAGYRVTQQHDWSDGKAISLSPNQRVFTPEQIPAGTRASGLGLLPTAPECETLAVWNDGTTAIGLSRVGAGWVVYLGPVFDGDQFAAVIEALLRHFGVADRVPATVAPQRGLHFRHFIGNTGLHDVWILFNESDVPLTTDVIFGSGVHPESLTDIVTGRQAAIARNAGGDIVRGIASAPWQSRMYLSPRADVAASPMEWLKLQRGWWQGTKTPPAKALPTPKKQQRFSLDLTDGWAYKDISGLNDDQVMALARTSFNDSAWERRRLNLWLTPGDKSPKRILLRRSFTVPPGWTAGRIGICADVPYAQFFYDTRVFVDGEAWNGGRKTVDGPYFDSLGGRLKAGSTHLLALDIGSQSTLIGSRGPVWLYYLPDPHSKQDLAGTWAADSDPLHRTGKVHLPGDVKAMYLSRTVIIDRIRKAQNVVIHFEAAGDRFSVIINGRILKNSGFGRMHSFSFNVTPLVRFGEENLVELAGYSDSNKSIESVELRFYEAGVYP